MRWKDERGAALPYVMMMAMLLMVIVPTVLFIGTNSTLKNSISEKEKIVTQLTVSGLQAIATLPGTKDDKLNYIKNHYINENIKQPGGLVVNYQQFVVTAGETNPTWNNRLSPSSLVPTGNYDIVSFAQVGTINELRRMNISTEVIEITLNPPAEQFSGDPATLTGSITAVNVSDPVTISINSVPPKTITLTANPDGTYPPFAFADLSDLEAGTYTISALIGGVLYDSANYQVHPRILTVTVSPNSHSNNAHTATVALSTLKVPDGTAVTVKLVSASDLNTVLATQSGLLSSNQAVLSLNVPAGLQAGAYKIVGVVGTQSLMTDYTLTGGFSVSTYPTVHQAGIYQMVAVTVTTTGLANGTPVSVEFVTNAGASLSPPLTGTGTISSNTESILLSIPTSTVAGTYRIKVTILGQTDSSTTYTISSTAPPSNLQGQAMTFVDGIEKTYTKAELQATGTITTTGILFIPESYGDVQLNNQIPVVYTAPEGIFIGANIYTQAAGGNITLKACRGSIEIDGAIFETGTGNTDITMQAGKFITAKAALFDGNSIILKANDYIDVSNAHFQVNGGGRTIILSALNNTTKILRSGAVFNGDTPEYQANNGTGVTCP